MSRSRLSVRGLMAFVVAFALALVSLRFASEPWAEGVVLLTLVVLALAVLGAAFRRGAARAYWLGFALFGWGYMVVASDAWWDHTAIRPDLLTTRVLDRLSPYLHAGRTYTVSLSDVSSLLGIAADPRDQAIYRKLAQPVSMSFANETPLEDVLKYIKSATTGPNDNGIPIYVDPVGLQHAEKMMNSPVSLDLEGVPLRTTLRIALAQLGLAYVVRDGLLTVTAASSSPTNEFRTIGQCYWALLAGWLGGIAGRRFHARRDADAP